MDREGQSAIPGKDIALFLFGVLVLFGLYLTSLYNYLLFHSLAEVFSSVVACGIFMLAWNSRRFLDNDYLLFLGIAYLFIGGMDLIHALAYKGMGVFPEYDANLPTQLWIATRCLESLSLLIAPVFLRRRLKPNLLFLGYTVVISLLLGSIFYWNIFPDCYVEGVGLTSFKKVSEYIISLLLLASVAVLLRKRREFDRIVLRLLVLSIIVTIGSELAFTLYISVYGFSNLVGHFFKILSFYLVYKAVIETGLVKPYSLLFRNLKQSEEELRQYTVELEARNEELDTFAHTVAHDLKTPLGHIVGFAQVLEKHYTTLPEDELHSYLHTMVQSGRKMSNIIDELLLLAGVRRMEEVELGPLDMASIVAEAQGRVAYLIEKHQAEIILPESWPVALGYSPWVEEVWVNYLSNAMKYGGQPPHVELGATEQADGMVRFWVRDNGPGLTPEAQARLFTPFTQLAQVRAMGHGLGLSIVRRIVEKLGGQVGVESQVGQGSVFTFTLPGTRQ
jgi:signal transduction histidine kinase